MQHSDTNCQLCLMAGVGVNSISLGDENRTISTLRLEFLLDIEETLE